MTELTNSGVKTTEFWMTIIATALSLLAAFGVIGVDEQAGLSSLLQTVVGGIIALVSLVTYIKERSSIKRVMLGAKS